MITNLLISVFDWLGHACLSVAYRLDIGEWPSTAVARIQIEENDDADG